MFNLNEMEASMGYVSTTASHPSDSPGFGSMASTPNYSTSSIFEHRNYHQNHHHFQQQQLISSGIDKAMNGEYGASNVNKSSHLAYMGSENVKRFSVNNLLNLVGYTEISRNQGV